MRWLRLFARGSSLLRTAPYISYTSNRPSAHSAAFGSQWRLARAFERVYSNSTLGNSTLDTELGAAPNESSDNDGGMDLDQGDPVQFTRARGGETITWKDIENFENDITETFIRGSGNGGQKVNKTSNCVQLRHVPSGIVVKCHATRSLQQNRKIARKRLQEQLEYILMHPRSRILKKIGKKRRQKSRKRRRQSGKYNIEADSSPEVESS
jgi:hypothetical protein